MPECNHCNKSFEELDHIILIYEDNVTLHYKCWRSWLDERFSAEEAIFKNGRVVKI